MYLDLTVPENNPFGANVFSVAAQPERLTGDAFENLRATPEDRGWLEQRHPQDRLPNPERRIVDGRQAHGALRAQGRGAAAAADGLGKDTGGGSGYAVTGWSGDPARQSGSRRSAGFSSHRRRPQLNDA